MKSKLSKGQRQLVRLGIEAEQTEKRILELVKRYEEIQQRRLDLLTAPLAPSGAAR